MSGQDFHVIEILDEKSTAVVPDLWLIGKEECSWPPYKTSNRINSAVQKEEVPGDGWSSHSIRILYSGSLERAREKLNRSELTSDLQSDDEPPAKRQKNIPRRLLSDESSEDSDQEYQTQASKKNPSRSQESETSPTLGTSYQLPVPPPRIEITPPTGLRNSRTSRVEEVRDVRMFRMLEQLQEQMREQTRLLHILVGRSAQFQEQAPSELPEGVSFPLKTLEDVAQFEGCILENKSATAVVRYLAEYGGSTVKETVERILKIVLVTDLARKYNFKGKKGKQKFEDLGLTSIIFRCLRVNSATRYSTKSDMEGAVKKWLSGARDRDGGRKERTRIPPENLAGAN